MDTQVEDITGRFKFSQCRSGQLRSLGVSDKCAHKQDEALNILSSNDQSGIHVSAKENSRMLQIIDRNIMPIMFVIYFLEMMDKQTVALSSVFGLSRETGLAGEDYSLVGSALYIAQMLFQPLSAFFLVKFRLSIYVPVIVTCWGITLACMASAHSFSGLLVTRLFLGTFEASIQGAYILTAQNWYRRREQGIRLAIWYSSAGLVNIVGPLIMFGVGHIHSTTLYSYQIVSILLGVITVIVGLLALVAFNPQGVGGELNSRSHSINRFSLFPDNPVKCKFLSESDKVAAIERIRANQQGLTVNVFKVSQVVEMILDIKSWCWMGLSLVVGVPSGSLLNFGPFIVKGFGFSGDTVMLLMIPYGALQIIFLILGFWINHSFNKKWPVMLFVILQCLTASVILLVVSREKKDQPFLLLAYYLLSANLVCIPTIMNWQSSNVAGQSKKTATTSFMMMGYIGGNIIGPLLFTARDEPYYHRGFLLICICYSLATILIVCTVIYLKRLNEWNRNRRISRGKSAIIVDYSMVEADPAGSNQPCEIGLQAFDDLTDLLNDEFIYVY